MRVTHSDDGFYPDIISTNCANSIVIEGIDYRVPCGRCLPCQKKRRSDWSLRLEHEYLAADSAFFITLTYDDHNLPFHYYKNVYKKDDKGKIIDRWKVLQKSNYPTTNKKDLIDYVKRLRYDHKKYNQKHNTKAQSLRYYGVGEYGSKSRRPHYHLLLFNIDIANLAPIYNQWKRKGHKNKLGFVHVGTVSSASINYVTKYMFKDFDRKHDEREPPFSIMSKKPIIGNSYLEQYGSFHLDTESLITADSKGNNRRIPKAYLYKLWQKYQQVWDTNKKQYVWKMAKDTDKIKDLTDKSYKKHYKEKIEQFEKNLKKYYNGDTIDYLKTQESELARKVHKLNNAEFL